MMTDDPWKDLTAPLTGDALSARRVDANLPWNFFWARGQDRRHLLVLRHASDASPIGRLPRIKGIETTLSDAEADGTRTLVFRLMDGAQRDIFHRLCLDIISATSRASAESEAVSVALARTWRWHHLLRGGGDGRLSQEEQKGLVGELLVLECVILPLLSAQDAVTAWRGPLGAPKDFEIGRVCIEAKARRGAARPHVAISSEYQLDADGTDALFLYVAEVDAAPARTDTSFCVTDIARRVHGALTATDTLAADVFDTLLGSAGFAWEDDYSTDRFVVGATRLYRVSGTFPKVTPSGLPPGVREVRYSVSLPECASHEVELEAIEAALSGQLNGD